MILYDMQTVQLKILPLASDILASLLTNTPMGYIIFAREGRIWIVKENVNSAIKQRNVPKINIKSSSTVLTA